MGMRDANDPDYVLGARHPLSAAALKKEEPPSQPPEPKGPELTYGQKAVGLTFNPSGDLKVRHLKEIFAEAIDTLATHLAEGYLADEIRKEAVMRAIDAQMWAVKTVTFK